MSLYNEEKAVADSAVGTNLISGHRLERVDYARVLLYAFMVGANAAGEEVVDIKVDGKVRATLRTSSTGLTPETVDHVPLREYIKPNGLVEVEVKVAPTVNSTLLGLYFMP